MAIALSGNKGCCSVSWRAGAIPAAFLSPAVEMGLGDGFCAMVWHIGSCPRAMAASDSGSWLDVVAVSGTEVAAALRCLGRLPEVEVVSFC